MLDLSPAYVRSCKPRHVNYILRTTLALAISTVANAEFVSNGYLELGGSGTSAESAWNTGGSGALGKGDGGTAEARLGFEFKNESRFSAHLSVLARAGTDSDAGRKAGLLDAYFDYGDLAQDSFRIRTGLAFSGSSLENVEDFWQTPYSLSLSALNSWIGEEFRPLGITGTKRFAQDSGATFDFSTTLYGGNDTSAAILAWRGFAVHDRLSVFGEALPLLTLPSLSDSGGFKFQRNDGSQPFGSDLDGRPGFALRARQNFVGGGRLNVYFTDNRGDRKLHGDEYAWHTRFGILGFDQPFGDGWTVLGEWMRGRTDMGFGPGPFVSFDFDAAYLAISRNVGLWSITGRAETFHINELDRSAAERNTQNGVGATIAVLRNSGDWRLGVEAQYFDIVRPGNIEFATTPEQGGYQLRVLARRYF